MTAPARNRIIDFVADNRAVLDTAILFPNVVSIDHIDRSH
jgi:hypothetical protein